MYNKDKGRRDKVVIERVENVVFEVFSEVDGGNLGL